MLPDRFGPPVGVVTLQLDPVARFVADEAEGAGADSRFAAVEIRGLQALIGCSFRIATFARKIGSNGNTPLVCRRMVWGSTTSAAVTGLVYDAKELGLFGTRGTRSRVNTTSPAVKALPFWKSVSRSLNSQVSGATRVQVVARPGTGRWCTSNSTSRSKICADIEVFGDRL